jgi:chaperone BCS1
MSTTFSPGHRSTIGLGGLAAGSALEIAATAIGPAIPQPCMGGSASRSALDLAVTAIAPEGLGPLAPLWKFLYGLIKSRTNFDITSITRKALIAFGAAVGLHFAWGYAKPLALAHLTSSITLPIEHKTARGIQKWLDAQGTTHAKRHLKYTVSDIKWNMNTQSSDYIGEKRTTTTGGVYFFGNHLLYLQYQGPPKDAKKEWLGGKPNEYGRRGDHAISGEQITVYSLDRSGDLLQRFSDHASAEEVKKTRITPVFTVSAANDRYRQRLWRQRVKPVRSLSTIDLDLQIKADLIRDLDRFLSANRAKWYSARVIPYKRGILLQGPPGTGKSSISLALAGHIGGPLYTIAIGEVDNEGHLIELFASASYGSCVLLEDIDSAGIGREKGSKDCSKVSSGDKDDVMKPDAANVPPNPGPISLSGLLNAIDALADGVILIMTTNEPENLDKALIRPGRIDKQIHVGHASRAVAENIFKRFYDEDSNEQDVLESNARIAVLARQFAGKIPDLKFTPAEIQGFLTPLSDSPEKAIADADEWVSDLLTAKMAGKNVVGQTETTNTDDDGAAMGSPCSSSDTLENNSD